MAKITFLGTPEFALPSLDALSRAHDLVAVVTQPDRLAGRRRRPRQSPVKRRALELGLPVLQPERVRQPAAIDALREFGADLFVVVAFGQILPQALLDLPRHGTVNVHASLLPRWRGAAPIQGAIRAGDSESGVTIMLLDAGLDTGPTLSRRGIRLAPDETGASLHDKLAVLGAELLIETLKSYLAGDLQPTPQDDSLATYAPRIQKAEGEIDWSRSARDIDRQVRAFTPWPSAFTSWEGQSLKFRVGCYGAGTAPIGKVVEIAGRIAIGTGEGLYYPLELQLAGKKRLPVERFRSGQRHFVGAVLG